MTTNSDTDTSGKERTKSRQERFEESLKNSQENGHELYDELVGGYQTRNRVNGCRNDDCLIRYYSVSTTLEIAESHQCPAYNRCCECGVKISPDGKICESCHNEIDVAENYDAGERLRLKGLLSRYVGTESDRE